MYDNHKIELKQINKFSKCIFLINIEKQSLPNFSINLPYHINIVMLLLMNNDVFENGQTTDIHAHRHSASWFIETRDEDPVLAKKNSFRGSVPQTKVDF